MNTDEIKRLYDEFADGLYHFLLRRTGDQIVAEDLLHDVFIQSIKYYERKKVRNPRSWLFTIARNTLRAHYATVALEQSMLSNTLQQLSDDGDAVRRVENQLDWEQLSQQVVNILAAVDPVYADIFILKTEVGLPHREIIKTLDISRASYYRRLDEVKTLLAQRLGSPFKELLRNTFD